ncbi:MAG: 3-oxoacyl-(acyl-carrier-protein) reductase [Acidimicrobiaceae bacterium]|nr:3-oxoacyl-(acyl-carrier-protein) reductase [Acidimicrobiaceae bacterium]
MHVCERDFGFDKVCYLQSMAYTSLQNKVAIVTGAGSGIGKATAERLALEGVAVIVADIQDETAKATAETITAQGGKAAPVHVDISSEEQVEAMVARAIELFGGLHILHNNAARLSGVGSGDKDVTRMESSVWDSFMAVNLRGPMLCCKHAIPRMLESGGGSIINMSSTAALSAQQTRLAYAVAKRGVNALTQHVATAYGKDGIRANSICPGPVQTEGFMAHVSPEYSAILRDNVLTPYVGEPSDIAALVAFLASSESRYINGQIISADGGMLIHYPTMAQLRAIGVED